MSLCLSQGDYHVRKLRDIVRLEGVGEHQSRRHDCCLVGCREGKSRITDGCKGYNPVLLLLLLGRNPDELQVGGPEEVRWLRQVAMVKVLEGLAQWDKDILDPAEVLALGLSIGLGPAAHFRGCGRKPSSVTIMDDRSVALLVVREKTFASLLLDKMNPSGGEKSPGEVYRVGDGWKEVPQVGKMDLGSNSSAKTGQPPLSVKLCG